MVIHTRSKCRLFCVSTGSGDIGHRALDVRARISEGRVYSFFYFGVTVYIEYYICIDVYELTSRQEGKENK